MSALLKGGGGFGPQVNLIFCSMSIVAETSHSFCIVEEKFIK